MPTRPRKVSIRKYVFSLDHKVIGLQYYFLALTAVFVGMFLSLLMRIHLIWPTASLPLLGEIKPEAYLSLLTMHGTIMVFFVLTTAPQGGFGNYFLPIQIGAPDMAFPVLNMLSFWVTAPRLYRDAAAFFVVGGAPLHGWTGYPPLSALPSAGPGEGRRGFVGHQHRSFLPRRADERAQLHHHHSRHARQGHDPDAHAANLLGLVYHRDPGSARVWRAFFRRHFAAAGPQRWHQLFRAPGHVNGQLDGSKGGSPLLWQHLFWFFGHPRGVHRDFARYGLVLAVAFGFLAQADIWL